MRHVLFNKQMEDDNIIGDSCGVKRMTSHITLMRHVMYKLPLECEKLQDSRDRLRVRVDVQGFAELRHVQLAPSHTWLKSTKRKDCYACTI